MIGFQLQWRFSRCDLEPVFATTYVPLVINGKLQKRPKLKMNVALEWTLTGPNGQLAAGEQKFDRESDPKRTIGVPPNSPGAWAQIALEQLRPQVNELRDAAQSDLLGGMVSRVSNAIKDSLQRSKAERFQIGLPLVDN